MAWDEIMDSGLHQGMFYLPTEQDRYSPPKNPTLSYHYRTRGASLPTGLYGSYHWATPRLRPRCDTHHCRSWVLPKRHIPTLFYRYHRGGNCPAISRPCVPMVWTPKKIDHRPRPSFHISLQEGTYHASGYPTESVHGLPPSNRWTI